MDFRRMLLVAVAGLALASANAHAAEMNCIGPASAQLCTDAFGNQTRVNRIGNTTRMQFSAVSKPPDEETTAAMMTDSGWQVEEMPKGTFIDPSLSYELDHVSAPLPPARTRPR